MRARCLRERSAAPVHRHTPVPLPSCTALNPPMAFPGLPGDHQRGGCGPGHGGGGALHPPGHDADAPPRDRAVSETARLQPTCGHTAGRTRATAPVADTALCIYPLPPCAYRLPAFAARSTLAIRILFQSRFCEMVGACLDVLEDTAAQARARQLQRFSCHSARMHVCLRTCATARLCAKPPALHPMPCGSDRRTERRRRPRAARHDVGGRRPGLLRVQGGAGQGQVGGKPA